MQASDQQQPYRATSTPEEVEVARAQAIISQAELRIARPVLEPATVISFDQRTGLVLVKQDSSVDDIKPTPCYSIVDDVAPSERVYLQHNPPHTALIVGRAAPAIHTPFPWAIQGGAGFTPGTGVANQYEASYSKRGPICDFRFTVDFGAGCQLGDGRWVFPLPYPMALHAGYAVQDRWIAIGEGTLYLGVSRNFVFTSAPGYLYALAWYNGGTSPIGGASADPTRAGYFPGGQAAFDAAPGGFFTGSLSFPTD